MYYLLPFRFHVFRNQELLTNDLGDYLLLPRGSVQRIVDREVLPEEELYKNLTASFFIYEKPLPRLIDTMAGSFGYPQGISRSFYRRYISLC